MFKKILSIFLILILVFSSSVFAFASNTTGEFIVPTNRANILNYPMINFDRVTYLDNSLIAVYAAYLCGLGLDVTQMDEDMLYRSLGSFILQYGYDNTLMNFAENIRTNNYCFDVNNAMALAKKIGKNTHERLFSTYYSKMLFTSDNKNVVTQIPFALSYPSLNSYLYYCSYEGSVNNTNVSSLPGSYFYSDSNYELKVIQHVYDDVNCSYYITFNSKTDTYDLIQYFPSSHSFNILTDGVFDSFSVDCGYLNLVYNRGIQLRVFHPYGTTPSYTGYTILDKETYHLDDALYKYVTFDASYMYHDNGIYPAHRFADATTIYVPYCCLTSSSVSYNEAMHNIFTLFTPGFTATDVRGRSTSYSSSDPDPVPGITVVDPGGDDPGGNDNPPIIDPPIVNPDDPTYDAENLSSILSFGTQSLSHLGNVLISEPYIYIVGFFLLLSTIVIFKKIIS